jgi:hypothetical protein
MPEWRAEIPFEDRVSLLLSRPDLSGLNCRLTPNSPLRVGGLPQNATPGRILPLESRWMRGHGECRLSRQEAADFPPRSVGNQPRIGSAHNTKEGPMSVAKIIEISCESSKSFEDAIVQGIARASKTIHGITSAWVKEQHVVVQKSKIKLYRVDLKVTFVLD